MPLKYEETFKKYNIHNVEFYILSQNSVVCFTKSLGLNMGGQVGSCIAATRLRNSTQLHCDILAVRKAER